MTKLELFKMEAAIKDAAWELESAKRGVAHWHKKEMELKISLKTSDQYQFEGKCEHIRKVKQLRKEKENLVNYWNAELQKRKDKLNAYQVFA